MCLDPLLKSDFTEMHKMHSAKNLRCLVWILENIECILQILISRAEVRIQNIFDSDSSFYFKFLLK
jgi:hypothetical protein